MTCRSSTCSTSRVGSTSRTMPSFSKVFRPRPLSKKRWRCTASTASRRGRKSSNVSMPLVSSTRSSRRYTSCRTATVPAPCWSRSSPINGTSTPRRWRSPRSPRCAKARLRSCRRNGRRRSSIGWRTSSPGASRGKSGGGIRFRPGTGPTAKSSSPKARMTQSRTRSPTTPTSRRSRSKTAMTSPPIQRGAGVLPMNTCTATRMCSTPGSRRRCGRSRRSAGPTRRRS